MKESNDIGVTYAQHKGPYREGDLVARVRSQIDNNGFGDGAVCLITSMVSNGEGDEGY